jgi:arylsulfatase A-like enzyme
VRFTDRELGRLFEALERNPGPNGTVLIVTSDHGEGLGAYDRLGHGEVYTEELLRVLLMIQAPGVTPGPVRDLVRTLDVMPTVLALAQVEPEDPAMQGRNLLPILQGSASPPRFAVGQALSSRGGRDPRRSIKRDNLRLVLNAASGERWLYDLESDPGELHDLASERPELAAELEALLREELRRDALLRQMLGDPSGSDPLTDAQYEELRRLGYVGD